MRITCQIDILQLLLYLVKNITICKSLYYNYDDDDDDDDNADDNDDDADYDDDDDDDDDYGFCQVSKLSLCTLVWYGVSVKVPTTY